MKSASLASSPKLLSGMALAVTSVLMLSSCAPPVRTPPVAQRPSEQPRAQYPQPNNYWEYTRNHFSRGQGAPCQIYMHSLATTRQFWASVFVEGLSKNVDRRDVSESSTEYQRRVFEFKERIENLAVAKFGDRYAFFNEAVNSSYLTYDADAQIIWLGRRPYDSFFNAFPLSSTETTDHLTIRLMREVLKSGTYIGSNAFGATRVVRQDTIAVSAIRAKLPIATAISSPYSIPRGLTISDNQRITFGLPEISLRAI